MNTIYFFGSETCKKCKEIKKLMDSWIKENNPEYLKYKYIDALDEKTQDFCDKHNVDRLPHIKFYIDEKLDYELVEYINADVLKIILDTSKNNFCKK